MNSCAIERHHAWARCDDNRANGRLRWSFVGADQATVGDGDPVGIAAEIGQHLLGRAERRLGIDDPVLATKLPVSRP